MRGNYKKKVYFTLNKIKKNISYRSCIKYAGISIILLIIYILAGKLGLSLAFENKSASAVWPPTGIAIGALLVLGYRFWPSIFLGKITFTINLSSTMQ